MTSEAVFVWSLYHYYFLSCVSVSMRWLMPRRLPRRPRSWNVYGGVRWLRMRQVSSSPCCHILTGAEAVLVKGSGVLRWVKEESIKEMGRRGIALIPPL